MSSINNSMILTDSDRHIGSHNISVGHPQKEHKRDIVPCAKPFSYELIRKKNIYLSSKVSSVNHQMERDIANGCLSKFKVHWTTQFVFSVLPFFPMKLLP